jgi:hypothetical protein
VLALAMLPAAPGHAAPVGSPRWPFGPGETLQYDLGWEFIKGGSASMSVAASDAVGDSASGHWQITSLAWSTGIVDMFYTVRDTLVATVDSDSLWPVRFEKRQHEGSYHRDSTYVFDQGRYVHRNGGGFVCSTKVHDILSVLYRARSCSLKVGRMFSFDVYEGGKLYKAVVNVLRKETVTVPAGTYDCVVAEPILQSDAVFRQKGRLWVWFTDDSRRIPVLMRSAVKIGSIVAELTEYRPPYEAPPGGPPPYGPQPVGRGGSSPSP